jgi:hypothetical protein
MMMSGIRATTSPAVTMRSVADLPAAWSAKMSIPPATSINSDTHTREVIKRALELGASALILVHNHPSGDPTPSGSDVSVTNDLIRIVASLGITVYDHLIIGRGRQVRPARPRADPV